MRFYAFWLLIIGSLPIILKNPFYGLVIYTSMNIVRPELLFWGGRAPSNNSMLIVFLGTMVSIITHSSSIKFKKLANREIFLMFLLYIGVAISILAGNYTIKKQWYYATEILKISLLCSFAVLLLDSSKKIILFEKIMLTCFVFLAIWGIEQNYLGNYRLEQLGGYDSNGIAAIFVLFLPLALMLSAISRSKFRKILAAISAVLLILATIFTESRGGMLGLVAGFTGIVLFSKKKAKLILLTMLLITFTIPFISHDFVKRMETMRSEETLGGSAKSRLYLWQLGLLIFRDNPITGTGLLSYPLEKFKYKDQFSYLDPDFFSEIFREKDPKVTHNTYIKFLSDCGLLAALPYFLLILGTFVSNRKLRKELGSQPNEERDKEDLLNFLTAIECGILGNCISIFFIDANFDIFIYVQITICSIIRNTIRERAVSSNVSKSIPGDTEKTAVLIQTAGLHKEISYYKPLAGIS